MSFRTSKTVNARALAGLITAIEIERITSYANQRDSVRHDVLRIAGKALMKSWRMLHSELGDPFAFKQNWDEAMEGNTRVAAKVDNYTSKIVNDVSPSIRSLVATLQPTAVTINPTISTRYAVSSL